MTTTLQDTSSIEQPKCASRNPVMQGSRDILVSSNTASSQYITLITSTVSCLQIQRLLSSRQYMINCCAIFDCIAIQRWISVI